ncbi:unnamed protein product [Prorocentrum cordatum]|uniref:Decapping nuclease n=1 Tax=Prorocentrum cordatum TaxID=2364126 RepID=A0ABN9XZB9_9DINO|nr:unnamed protein product [Polarella glacialis]
MSSEAGGRAAVRRWPDTQGGEIATRRKRKANSAQSCAVVPAPLAEDCPAVEGSPAAKSTQASPASSASPGLADTDFNFNFRCSDKRESKGRIRAAATTRDLHGLIHVESLFHGFGDETDAYRTAQDALRSIFEDQRAHRDLADDSDVAYNHLCPSPFASALVAISFKEGWRPESALQDFKATAVFLEHPGTRLAIKPGDQHVRAPNIQRLTGAGGSARKSSKTTYFTNCLVGSAAAPQEFRDREFFCQDSTLRGIYDAILATSSAAVVSDEASITYLTPISDPDSGVYHLAQNTMCKLVNAEAMDALTGKGTTHLTEHRLMHRVSGQTEACEYIMIPKAHCFQKRMDFTVAPDKSPSNALQGTEASDKFIKDFFAWLFTTANAEKKTKRLERHALTLWRAVEKAT